MSRNPGLAGTDSAAFSAGGRHAASEAYTPGGDQDPDDDIDHGLLLASVARDARLNRKYLLLITLSAAIATLGLLQDSPAVVIGAMLVSPLLGPIMGAGFGLATLESELIRRSIVTLAAGVAAAILVAMAIVWLSPVMDVTGELRARTQPTLLDLGVAVVGGVAGVYAILRRLSGVMVGVAIATALVPPLSTIGFGLATARFDFALGAALLFLTNTLAITFTATLLARFNRFGPSLTPKHTIFQITGVVITLGILSIPLAISLNRIAREVAMRSTVQVELDELLEDQDRVDELTVKMDGESVRIDGVILVDRYRQGIARALSARAQRELNRPVVANIVQLRQQTDGSQFQDAFERRLAALEQRDTESARVLASLARGGAIPRQSITLDSQARRALVLRPPTFGDEAAAAAFDQALSQAQAASPSWLISAVAPPALTPTSPPMSAPATTAAGSPAAGAPTPTATPG